MKLTAFLVPALLSVSLLAPLAIAQGGPPGGAPGGRGQGGPRRGDKLILDQLHLTAGQQNKIKTYRDKMRADGMAFRKAHPGTDRTAMMAHGKQMRGKYMSFLKGVLSKGQFAKYESLRKQMRPAGGSRPVGAPRPAGAR